MNLTLTQRRACLALGSLAKNIAKEDLSRAEPLVEHIENWIQKHKEGIVYYGVCFVCSASVKQLVHFKMYCIL